MTTGSAFRRPPTFYHFTSLRWMARIIKAEVIKTTESNLSLKTMHAGPDVVWLMDRPIPDVSLVNPRAVGTDYFKHDVYFEVHVPAIRWWDWVQVQKGFDPDAARTLVEVGGGVEASSHWFVWDKPIPSTQWGNISVPERFVPTAERAALGLV